MSLLHGQGTDGDGSWFSGGTSVKVDCFSQGARRVAQKQEDDLLSYYETC